VGKINNLTKDNHSDLSFSNNGANVMKRKSKQKKKFFFLIKTVFFYKPRNNIANPLKQMVAPAMACMNLSILAVGRSLKP